MYNMLKLDTVKKQINGGKGLSFDRSNGVDV